jgi:IclR family transcriptional regulator, acetate operon repressor
MRIYQNSVLSDKDYPMPLGDFVDRVVDIIELIADEPNGMPLSEIAARLDMPKSAAHRLLATLVRRGFAEQDEFSQRYRLTVKLAAVGFRVLAASGTSDVCQPSLDRLAARTGELVRLAIVENDSLIWIAKAQGSPSGLRYDPDLGQMVVLHATATGKSWLATLSDDHAARLVRARGFVVPARFGNPVVRNEADLMEELARTRRRGFGVAIEEGEPGTCAMARAILAGVDRKAVATVSIAGPAARLTPARMEEFAPDLEATTNEIADIWPSRRVMEFITGDRSVRVARG